ncbi:MAG: GerW family sporulation protein [Oscillospiraceae bacterium]|nr:GerW family sporulation protein [Oscillospiraceae bacterium]
MKENHTIGNIMGITMEKLKEMVDVNTIVGEPISLQDGTTIIPISKVSFGFASGGSDLPTKSENELFGGGSGAGVSIQPLGFMVVYKGEAKLMQMSVNASTPNAVATMVPEIIDKVADMFGKGKKNKEDSETENQ